MGRRLSALVLLMTLAGCGAARETGPTAATSGSAQTAARLPPPRLPTVAPPGLVGRLPCPMRSVTTVPWVDPASPHSYVGGTLAPVAYGSCVEGLAAAHVRELTATLRFRCQGRAPAGPCRAYG
jgi:hypothetical protein